MAHAFNGIISKDQDIAGKWRVLVDIGSTQITPMLKFDVNPELSVVIAECDKLIANLEAAEQAAEAASAIEAAVETYRQSLINAS